MCILDSFKKKKRFKIELSKVDLLIALHNLLETTVTLISSLMQYE